MIVAIDGPAGAGKSSVSQALARRLGFRFLNTGAMYRAVALAAVRRRLSWDDPEALADVARNITLEVTDDQVFLDGEDVTDAIHTPQITGFTQYPANNAAVRTHLVELQRLVAGRDNIVTEGRDQGTVVFPEAECKIFLTASPRERARRRLKELESRGETATLDEILAQQNERDARDASRPVGPLVRAPDAVEFYTDGLDADAVVDRLEAIVRERLSHVGTLAR